MRGRIKTSAVLAILAILLSVSAVYAASTIYYAQIAVYFWVPSDATFNIAFPSTYASTYNESITGTTEAAATATTNWISFNFTTGAGAESYVQPNVAGDSATKSQSGNATPIFLIYNTGNANEALGMNMSVPTNFAVCVNNTCDELGANCASTLTQDGAGDNKCTALAGGTYTQIGTVNKGKTMNVTLYANKTAAATAGQTKSFIYINSTI